MIEEIEETIEEQFLRTKLRRLLRNQAAVWMPLRVGPEAPPVGWTIGETFPGVGLLMLTWPHIANLT